MIERAVFSYFNSKESFTNKCGFRKFEDFLYTTALAVVMATKHFPQVQMMSSKWGVDIFRECGLPVTEFSEELEKIKHIPQPFWAYGKLVAYTSQKEPFIHVDNDVFIWKPLPRRILEAELCFQSKEFMHLSGYKWYDVLKPCWRAAPVRPQIIVDNEVTDFAYNCGICGGHNLEFFQEWRRCSEQYIFAEKNQPLFFKRYKTILIHQNLFHEQYFAASLIKAHKMRGDVEVIADNIQDIQPVTNDGYTHMWGTTKEDPLMMRRVQHRLKKENPEVFVRILRFVENNIKKQKICRNIVSGGN